MKKRDQIASKIKKAFETHSVVAILGPRQCGKTTLARLYFENHHENVFHFDLEDPADVQSLKNPKTVLEPIRGLVVIDEIQRIPDLFQVIRVLVDQPNVKRKYLILGSASRQLIQQSSETLAGRIAYIELTPFSLMEVEDQQGLWIKGGFPRSYLSESIEGSSYWRKEYIKTFLEMDIPNLGIRIAPLALRRFWTMLAHYHGQYFKASEIGKSLGIADTTARNYLDILTGTFMIRQLLPWVENIKKRQVKTPKIYFRDTGIFHTIIGVTDYHSIVSHPKLGASWEGFALEEVIRNYQAEPEECYFWASHEGSEVDLLIMKDGKRMGFEFKFNDSPKLTKSMKEAYDLLKLDFLHVIYPGTKEYPLGKNILVKPLSSK